VIAAQPSLTWQSRLDGDLVAEVTALLDAATAADHIAPVSEHALLALRGQPGDGVAHLLARDAAGQLVGYAFLDGVGQRQGRSEVVGELAVHPEARRHGVGTALVEALLARVAGTPLRVWAHGEHPGAARLAGRLGFRQVRTLWQLHRDLREPLPEPIFPDDVRLRDFVVGRDESEFLRVNNAAFAWHPEQGGWDAEQVKLREAEPWFDPAGFLLAVRADDPDRVLGFHWTKVHGGGAKDGNGPIGEVYVLGVDPAAWGRGLGAALTLAGLHHLRGRGLAEVMLYVEADNASAVQVYQRLAFTHWRSDAAFLHE
jgi:mycothiol synthase